MKVAYRRTKGRRCGWSPVGEPAHVVRPVRSERLSIIGALALDGVRASVCLDGTVDGDAFLAFVEQMLVPNLCPGDIIVIDNLSAHNVHGVRNAIENVGARVLSSLDTAPT